MTEKINSLCRWLELGEIVGRPSPVSGGYLHRMFRVETARGIFAIKALDPEIMRRPRALANMRRGEETALALEAYVPLCASVGGVTQVDGTYFIAYPWVEGASVFPPQITAEHCRIMGDVLGRIHRSGVVIPGMEREGGIRQDFDWSGAEDPRLPGWDASALEGLGRLRETQVVSHRDLDPKNVLWQGMSPCIIDWEAAGYVNPWQELIEVINYWADDENKIRALIAGYGRHADLRGADWDAALAAGMDSMLGWLHYNLHRPGGEEHVRNTLTELGQYEQRMRLLRRLLP